VELPRLNGTKPDLFREQTVSKIGFAHAAAALGCESCSVGSAGFEPMLRGPGTNRFVPQELILSGFSRLLRMRRPFGFCRIPVRPLDPR
jgi:hypothetical protein